MDFRFRFVIKVIFPYRSGSPVARNTDDQMRLTVYRNVEPDTCDQSLSYVLPAIVQSGGLYLSCGPARAFVPLPVGKSPDRRVDVP